MYQTNKVHLGLGGDDWLETRCIFGGRNLLDSLIMESETMNEGIRKIKTCMLFIVDYEKAYAYNPWWKYGGNAFPHESAVVE